MGNNIIRYTEIYNIHRKKPNCNVNVNVVAADKLTS